MFSRRACICKWLALCFEHMAIFISFARPECQESARQASHGSAASFRPCQPIIIGFCYSMFILKLIWTNMCNWQSAWTCSLHSVDGFHLLKCTPIHNIHMHTRISVNIMHLCCSSGCRFAVRCATNVRLLPPVRLAAPSYREHAKSTKKQMFSTLPKWFQVGVRVLLSPQCRRWEKKHHRKRNNLEFKYHNHTNAMAEWIVVERNCSKRIPIRK